MSRFWNDPHLDPWGPDEEIMIIIGFVLLAIVLSLVVPAHAEEQWPMNRVLQQDEQRRRTQDDMPRPVAPAPVTGLTVVITPAYSTPLDDIKYFRVISSDGTEALLSLDRNTKLCAYLSAHHRITLSEAQ